MSACTKFERSRWTATPYRSDLRKPEAEAEAEPGMQRERGVELSKNTSISSGVTDTSDNFRSCNPGVFNSGATYRLEIQCYHLAGKSERNNNSHNKGLSMSSNAKAVTLLWIPRRARLGHLKGKTPSEYRSETP